MPQIAIAALSASASFFAANAATLVISTALSTVASLAFKPDAPEAQGQLVSMDLATTAPRRWQAGTRGNGGSLVDWYTTGHKNQNLFQVIYLGEGPMGALTGIWSQGRKVYTGNITNGQRVELTGYRSPDPRCYVTYYDGSQTSADPTLLSAGAGYPASSIGVGCAYVMVEMIWDPDTMPFPASFFFETQGAKFYDRRKDSTAGGIGSHRLVSPSTWEVTSNPAVVADHYMLGKYRNALEVSPHFGIGLHPNKVPYDRFAALANLCDEDVTVSTGWQGYGGVTQKRYAANGIIHSNRTHKSVLNDLARAMNARAVDLGGRVTFISNEAQAPVLTIDETDLLEGAPERYEPKNAWAELINGVRGTYQDVNNNYNPVDYPAVTDAGFVAEDGGEEKYDQLDLPFETDAERAQRLAWLYLQQKRQQATLNGVYPLWAIELEEGDWFTRTGGRFGAGKTFQVMGTPLLDPDTLTVTINAREVDNSNSAWSNTSATTANIVTVADNGPTQLDAPSMSVTAIAYTTGVDGSVTMPAIRFTNNDFADVVSTSVDIQIATSDGNATPGPTGEVIGHTMQNGQQSVALQGVLPLHTYVWRVRAVLGTRFSDWSDWYEVTTPDGFVSGDGGSLAWADITGRPKDAQLLHIPAGKLQSLLPNPKFVSMDSEGKPAGIEACENVTGREHIETIDDANGGLRILGTSQGSADSFVAYAFPAIPIEDNAVYTIRVRHRAAPTSTTSGLYLRMNEKNAELADGATCLGTSTGGPRADERTSLQNLADNIGLSSGWVEQSFTYTPTVGTKFASFAMMRWSGFAGDSYEIEWAQMSKRPDFDAGADVTGDNVASAFVGQDWGATASQPSADNNYVQSQSASVNAIAVSAAFDGTVHGGQLPRSIQMTRIAGSTDRTASTTWSIAQQSGCTASVSSAGLVTVTAMTASGQVVVRGVYSGQTIETTIATSLNLSAPPVSGGGGGSGDGTTASDSTFDPFGPSTTSSQVSDTMTVSTGSAGTLNMTGYLTLSIVTAGGVGSFKNVAAYWATRLPGGSWTTQGPVFNSHPDPQDGGGFGGEGFGFAEPGSINVAKTVTGLSANTDYEVRLVMALSTAATGPCYTTGTVTVSGT